MKDWKERWEKREGILTLGVVPRRDAQRAIHRSLPRISDAIRLVRKVEALLGDRLAPDVMAGPGNSLFFLRDREHPAFVVAHSFLSLDVNVPPPPPLTILHLTPPIPEDPPPPRPEEPAVLPGPERVPGKLRVAEGPAYLEIRYGDDGTLLETLQSGGDSYYRGAKEGDLPYQLDPLIKPRQSPPIGLYCRPDLDPEGHDLDALARMVAELAPERLVPARVFQPVPGPGGAGGCWMRGLWRLKEALWEGRIDEEAAGWVVIDAWTGRVAVVGPTLAEAFAAWREAVAHTQPLPPRDPPPPPEEDIPDEPPSMERDEEDKTVRISTGTVRITVVPRVTIDWPEPRPENVPAVALPLPAAAPIPPEWAGYGFTRRVRLVGERGEVVTAFVRDEPQARFTLVGERALAALRPETLDEELDRLDGIQRRKVEESGFWPDSNPYEDSEYPYQVSTYRVWDDTGRVPELGDAGIGWCAETGGRSFDADYQGHLVVRARRLRP